ncbi:MAG: class I SAM-dependent methyltransferase [Anaerolineaceae bacterium]|nr:class I SAM-dependent methyltransferase [Anaerolineaceae bacterium]
MSTKETSDYYNTHWTSFASQNYPQAKILQAARFFSPIVEQIQSNQNILDIGCGDGVHWHYLKKCQGFPIQFTGIDVSHQSINFLTKLASESQDAFLQMDACDLQFEDSLFDLVFAYGVIGYTESPHQAFVEMTRVCKPGGYIGIFSPEIIGVSSIILNKVRSISQRLGDKGQRIFANLLVPFFGLAPSESKISLKNAAWQQVQEVILTDIAPPHLIILPHRTLLEWFEEIEIAVIFDDPHNRSMIWRRKLESIS